MDHKNAAALLEETFDNEFNIDRYTNFIKELFNHIKISVRDVPLRKEYYNYIDTVNSLGVYRDNDKHSIEVFAIKLKRTSSRDRARTMQRNLIARYLSQFNRDAALVAFYGDDPEDWRFSFVKMEYDLTKDKNGNLKVTEELTPAKRYSFLVGKNESNHTCKIQFIELIKEEDRDPRLLEIEEKFSVENVTKEFFTAYKKLFLDLKDSLEQVIDKDSLIKNEFKDKNILTTDFAKKLLGQIVFVYFLQKKGWLGVKKQESWGAGPKNFLRKLFNGEMANYGNFYNEMLEPLFYEALATERDGDYYSRFNCRIPFLNGGLFEPINDYDWIETDITLNNDIFKEILDTFDLFNFTVKEDEPLEKEVAVDPEMLGKVFENLLEVTDRKSKGAFYTPREIVHYMCQQSLVNYLETNISTISKQDIKKFILKGDLAIDSIIREQEQKKTYHGQVFQKQLLPESIKENSDIIDALLKDIKVVDPAVGSGAFPVGMMNEIVRARHIISLLSNKEVNNYDLKRETVENSLYGVDIDSSAVDITKLRFWLSLVVDEEDIQNIKPLPNLDHKIMCGNSLIDEFEGTKLFEESLLEVPEIDIEIEKITTEKEYLEKKLQQLMDEDSQNIDQISEIDNQISKLRKKIKKNLSRTTNKFQASLYVSEAQKQLKKLKTKHEQFFNAESPNKKKKLRQEIDLIEWEFIEETLKIEGNEETIVKLEEYKKNKSKPFFLWKLYFSEVFRRKNPGFDVVIANPPYIRHEKIKEFKPYLKKKFETFNGIADIYVYFFEKGLNLLNNKGTLTFICSDKFTKAKYGINLRKFLLDYQIERYIDLAGKGIFEDATVDPCVIVIKNHFPKPDNEILINDEFRILQNRFDDGVWNFKSPEVMNLMDKINKTGIPLKDIENLKIYYGIKTGFDKAFVIDEKTKNKLINENERNSEVIKPLLRGRDIKKWKINFQNLYLIKTQIGIPIKNYPAIKHHLDHYKEKLIKRTDQGDHWWELRACSYYGEFDKKKIIYPNLATDLFTVIDEDNYYTNPKCYIITVNNPEFDISYIASLLSSKTLNFIFKLIGTPIARTSTNPNERPRYDLHKNVIERLPIYPASIKEQKPLIENVNLITNLNKDFISEINRFKNFLREDFEINKFSQKLDKYYELSLENFLNEIKKNKVNIKDKETREIFKNEFENSLMKINQLLLKIDKIDNDINLMIYKLYGLNQEEIEIVEKNK